jgi:16S rRNA (guanine(527)-N(7))-methyltransferase RsmG
MIEEKLNVRTDFISALQANQEAFGIELTTDQCEQLADYYELILEHNDLLHLVGPATPEEFAVRHILESLTLLKHLPSDARVADVGTGAGLPLIPCLLVRPGLHGFLIESKEKKATFLRTVVSHFALEERTSVINKQFSEVPRPNVSYVTCRALDKFTQKLPALTKWSGRSTMLLFGGPSLREALQLRGTRFSEELMPLSEQRYLFITGK